MKECKNIECKNKTKNNNIYCSLSCRNIYVNKYLRNYDKMKETLNRKKDEKEKEYYLKPNLCKNCNNIVKYENKNNKTCSKNCFIELTSKNNPSKNLTLQQKIIKNNKIKETFSNKIKIINNKKYICNYCKNEFKCKIKKKYCSKQCVKKQKQKHFSEFKKYKILTNFKFSLNTYPDEYDFSLIKKYGWYKAKNRGNNLNGVSRDHIVSVNYGFKNNINPLILAHPANCQLLRHNDNVSKHTKNDLTITELLNKIIEWEIKYGCYYKY